MIKNIKIDDIIFNTIEFFLVIIIVLSYYLTFGVETKRVIHIPKGSTSFIVSYLDKKDYDMNHVDKLVLRALGHPQSGWIDLKATNMSKFDFLYRLTTSKAALKKITLIPGETYYFFLQDLAKKLNLSTYELFDLYASQAYRKDGNIIADTYHIPYGMSEKQLMDYLLKETDKRYESLSKRIFGIYNKKNWYKYITLASIIQKEAASKDEMALVSSVIYNRLRKEMKLQMDGTLNYAKYSHTKVTREMIKTDTTSYNTYKNKGLPDDPVCAVEFEAIKAAIFPAKTDYLYFMKAVDGSKHMFTNSYKKHKKNISKVVKEKKRIARKKALEEKRLKKKKALEEKRLKREKELEEKKLKKQKALEKKKQKTKKVKKTVKKPPPKSKTVTKKVKKEPTKVDNSQKLKNLWSQ